jgi:hypothetical protein
MKPNPPGGDAALPRRSDEYSVPWTPSEIARGSREACVQVPFVVQSGRALLMVEAVDEGWTLAELAFQPGECSFLEVRRATYAWPREAFGALLSRVAGAQPDEAAIARLTAEFTTWLGDRFARRGCDRPVPC